MQLRWEAVASAAQRFRKISALGRRLAIAGQGVRSGGERWSGTAVIRRAAWKEVRWAILCSPERRKLVQQELDAQSLDINPNLREAHDLFQQSSLSFVNAGRRTHPMDRAGFGEPIPFFQKVGQDTHC